MNREDLIKNAPNPHIPPKLPIDLSEVLRDEEVIKLISEANRKIGMYNGFLFNTPNPNLLISPLITKEASLSSKLEGTHATIEDIFRHDAGMKVDVEEDEMKEVTNYRKALFYSLDKMGTFDENTPGKLPLSNRLIKDIHKILLDNVRGSTKSPGEFKTLQNYIGGTSDISFTPLPPHLTDEYMHNLEEYIHDERVDSLLQAALIHVQFEMIHPFQDGNGRIGRLLIPLFLYYRGLLILPTFYMSRYFESDRILYLEYLSKVSKENNYKDWIKYFLKGVIAESEENTNKASLLLREYENIKNIATKNINSQYLLSVIDFMFQSPVFKVNQLIEAVPMSRDTAYSIVNQLTELNILSHDGASRNKTYIVNSILNHIIQ